MLGVFLGGFSGGVASADQIKIHDPWVRAVSAWAPVMSGYMVIDNPTEQSETITRISSPAFRKVTLSQSKGGRKGLGRWVIPAHGRLELKPHSQHMVLRGPKRALKAGERVPFRLHAANGEVYKVTAEVRGE